MSCVFFWELFKPLLYTLSVFFFLSFASIFHLIVVLIELILYVTQVFRHELSSQNKCGSSNCTIETFVCLCVYSSMFNNYNNKLNIFGASLFFIVKNEPKPRKYSSWANATQCMEISKKNENPKRTN